jgi:hypothetical protein
MKIFEIGIMKTGTSSLGLAYEKLGFKHKGWSEELYEEFKQNKFDNIFKIIDKYDAFEDGPWHDINFIILDKKYKNSKFILLERDNESWIKSVEYHTSPKYNINNIKDKYLDYRWLKDRESLITEKIKWKNKKYKKIKEYFIQQNRYNDLLIMKITDGWPPLCKFLNVPIPNCDFPKINTSDLENIV